MVPEIFSVGAFVCLSLCYLREGGRTGLWAGLGGGVKEVAGEAASGYLCTAFLFVF